MLYDDSLGGACVYECVRVCVCVCVCVWGGGGGGGRYVVCSQHILVISGTVFVPCA